jgi:heptosyltransferase-1
MPWSPPDLTRLQPRRVCIIKPSSLGDVVHALPVLAALRARWPDAHLSWVVNAGLRGLLDSHPMLDEVIPFDRGTVRATLRGVATASSFLGGLRRRRFDLAIDLQGLLRSGVMALATGAPIRVGLASAREGAGWCYTHRVPEPDDRPHAVDRLLAVARAFGADVSRPRFVVAMTPDDRRWAREALRDVPSPRLVLNIGARWLTKRWPPRSFAEIARRAVTRLCAGLVVVGGQEDRPLVDELRRELGAISALDLCGGTTLPRLAAVAAESDLFLSNDSGPLHLAAAAGASVVGVYTCTRPEWTGPYGPRAIVVPSKVWCAGSCRKSCPRMECMPELTPDRVWPVVEARLTSAGMRRGAEARRVPGTPPGGATEATATPPTAPRPTTGR